MAPSAIRRRLFVVGGAMLVAFTSIAVCSKTGRGSRPQPPVRTYHFSVDDVTDILKDLAAKPYRSMFEQPALHFLRQLHQRYGTNTSLYVFYKGDSFDLTQMPTRYKQEFTDNADWLKLGFHSFDKHTRYLGENDACARRAQRDYRLVAKQISRFAGERTLASFVRLHLWYASDRALRSLREVGLRGILVKSEQEGHKGSGTADPQSRHESRGVTWSVDESTGVAMIATDLAFEQVPPIALEDHLAKLKPEDLGTFEGFVHEPFLNIRGTRNCLEKAAKLLGERGYVPVHYGEVIMSAALPSPSSPAAIPLARSPR